MGLPLNAVVFRPCLVILLSAAVVTISAEMDFTYSASHLYRLIQTEQLILGKLRDIQRELEGFRDHLNKYINEAVVDPPETVIKNPILSYKLVKRHSQDFEGLDKLYEDFAVRISEFQKDYKKQRTTFTKPTHLDTAHAMEAIVRMRQTYKLSVDKLSQGRIGNLKMEGSLSPKDLADIGLYAKTKEMRENARLFLMSALQHSTNSSEEWIQTVTTQLNELIRQKEKGKRSDQEDYRILTEMNAIFAPDSLERLNTRFEELCQYYAVKDAPPTKLKCHVDRSSGPMRAISPLKIEIVHEDPQIVLIYDFLTDSEIEAINSATFFTLQRSLTQVIQPNGELTSEPSIIRTTSQTWIHDLDHPQFGYLSKRIESATGYYLSGRYSAEDLQVASYRPGGHYSLHTDAMREEAMEKFVTPEDIIQGDRVATFMLYLSDVEMGGNTAFPMISVSVKPVKGSAILWGDLYPDGKISRDSLHGACPVIYGTKIIATKWIRANDQMFTRQNCKPDKRSDHFYFSDD